MQLFEKTGRRMCLTSEGKWLMPHIHDLMRAMALTRQSAHQDAQPSGDLRVAAGETLLVYKISQVLQRFKQRAFHVRLSLQSLNCHVIRDVLLSDNADLRVSYRVGNDDALGLMSPGDQSLALAASPLLQRVDFTQHNQHIPCSFITNESQCILRQRFERLLCRRQITLENAIELWSIESTKQCASANLGISFLPYSAVEKELCPGELIELPFGEQPELITALCGYHAGEAASPAIRMFLECIKESSVSRKKMPG